MMSKKTFGLISSVALLSMGVSYGCSSTDSGTTNTQPGVDGGNDSSATNDSGGNDSSVATQDSGSADSGVDLACPPASTTAYTPPTYTAAVANQGVCTAPQIQAYIVACGDTGTTAGCDAWKTANVGAGGNACGNCIVTPNNSGGVYIDPKGNNGPNYGACIQLKDAANGAACAAAYNNQGDCEAIACDACTTDADDVACLKAADLDACVKYVTAAKTACVSASAAGGAFDMCTPDTQGANADFTLILTLVCGAP